MTLKDFSPAEALDCAINSEDVAAKFYGSVSEKIENPAVRKKFESLAAEEREHCDILKKAKEKILSAIKESLPDPTGGCGMEVQEDFSPESFETVESVIHAAIKAEEFAAAFYTRAAEASSDSETSEIFKRLAAMELGHKRELQEELDFLGNNKFYWLSSSTDQRSMEY